MPISGQCLCGAVRYQGSEGPITTRVCWCRLCQYIGAGSGTVNSIFLRAAIHVTGVLQDYPCLAESGNHMHRQFCGICGTHLFAYAEERPTLLVVRVGSLDDRERVKPASSIWISAAPSWSCIDLSLPQVAGQPPPVV